MNNSWTLCEHIMQGIKSQLAKNKILNLFEYIWAPDPSVQSLLRNYTALVIALKLHLWDVVDQNIVNIL